MHATKKGSSGAKSTKPSHRTSKRASTSTAHSHLHSPISPDSAHSMTDGRHKRVWKACERCRMKKTKVRPACRRSWVFQERSASEE